MYKYLYKKCPPSFSGVSKSRYFARSIAIKYSNFSRFYKKKGPFYKKIPFLELLETPNIRCPVGGSIGGCGARAVSRKTHRESQYLFQTIEYFYMERLTSVKTSLLRSKNNEFHGNSHFL